jgi:hypothetical protein
MAPAEGRRRMNATERRGLRQALAFDHRSGVIEPAFLLAQMRHGRPGQRVERAPAALATEAQKSVRAAPADDFVGRAMRTALAFHTLMAGRSKRVPPMTAPDAFLRRPLRPIRRPGSPLFLARRRERPQRFPSLLCAQSGNRRKPRRAFIDSIPPIRPSLT